jgi:hypothetical protein
VRNPSAADARSVMADDARAAGVHNRDYIAKLGFEGRVGVCELGADVNDSDDGVCREGEDGS